MIVDENDKAVSPQIGLVDGYRFGDRLLEGVMFVVKNEDGKLVCNGVQTAYKSYLDDFSEKKKQEWFAAAVESALDGEFTGPDDQVCYWDGEGKSQQQAIPIQIETSDINQIFDLGGKKKGG